MKKRSMGDLEDDPLAKMIEITKKGNVYAQIELGDFDGDGINETHRNTQEGIKCL